jgi:purine-binding chemotaxis protein CheW
MGASENGRAATGSSGTLGQAAGDVLQLVSFRLGAEEYGLETLKVQEIIRLPDITRVPNSPQCIKGVTNLRGKVIPVIGLRQRFGLAPRDQDKETRVIVVEVNGDIIGFEVDSVSEVLRIPMSTVEPPPRLSKRNNEYISGVAKIENRLLLLLNVNRLISETDAKAAPGASAAAMASLQPMADAPSAISATVAAGTPQEEALVS